MVWSKPNTFLRRRWDTCKPAVKGISHLSKRAKQHSQFQFWLWRKRQESGVFRMCTFKQRMLKNLFWSQPQLAFKTKRDKRNRKTLESSDVTSSKSSSDMSNGTEKVKLESCKVNNVDLQSMTADVSTVHNTLNGAVEDMSLLSHNVNSGSNVDCVCHEDEQKLTADNNGAYVDCVCHEDEQKLTADNNGAYVDCVCHEDEQKLTVHNNAGDLSEIKCPRQKMSENIREYLCDFHRKYGSLFPLEKSGIFKHLKETFNKDFTDCRIMILEIIIEELAKMINAVPHFELKYKKHRLTSDDLSTLANDNWLNDQVINMYGELIMQSADSKVHFLNSFFYRQLITKGYEGVKRWTKQVDLFSKCLLLVPVHLEVHWCLVTADFIKKTVCLYDSQGLGLQKVARNIVRYLVKEAQDKKQPAFQIGWTVSLREEIPQQTNENDCGVFVLEYSRCLALSKPLQFLQRDVPKIRKRIYKELCDCILH